ncbi:MAG TPA: transglycosylase SLT domain-containing protein [Candidatus Binatia bacterium]|nr:transglycosylase SLT domain-containing protein [Candidatus Binatia bacterium]
MLGRYRESVRMWIDPIGRVLYRRLHLRPNHLTVLGLGVSLLAATAFCTGRTRGAGVLLILAGLCDFFDGALARASGQVSAFGAFLDSVIDRYSDLVVLLGIVVLFAQMPHARGAIVAMAGLIGSMMVSYTKARAESIGVRCTVGMMERPERMICLIAGALLDQLEPALWVLAVLSNLTAIQRIAFTWRATRDAALLRVVLSAAVLLLPVAVVAQSEAPGTEPQPESAWGAAVGAYQQGDVEPLIREFGTDAARDSVIGDHVRYLVAEALSRGDDLARARATALSVVDRYPKSRLAPRALLLAATLDLRAEQDASAQTILVRLINSYPDSGELSAALYLLAMTAETLGQLDAAALTYRDVRILTPTSGYADGAGDRIVALQAAGIRLPPMTPTQRVDRAERLFRGDVPDVAMGEAERIVDETKESAVVTRALRVVVDSARRLGRYDVAARTLGLVIDRSPAARRPGLKLEQARLYVRAADRRSDRAGHNESIGRALTGLDAVAGTGAEAEKAEALYLKARVLEDLTRESEAITAYRAVAAQYPTREAAAASLWRLGWLAYGKRDAPGAQRSWTRLVELGSAGAYRMPALYWAGRAREQVGGAGAADLYNQILAEAPRSYYGLLAAGRIGRAKDGGVSSPIALPPEPRVALADDSGFARVELLRRLNLVEEAAVELEDVVQGAASDPVRLYGLAGAYVEVERYHMALRIMRRHFQSLAATGDPTLPRAFWEMFYPYVWRDEVRDAAQRRGIDPYLVAAVVREESSYYPRATSRAGARGLMQLMPATARLMAPTGDLEDPVFNIELGTRFLAGLMREFNDPRLALAAYNAGPNRVRQWLNARRSDDIEAFVEQIPFDETRLYVKKVVLSWDEYRRIYGGP